MIKNKIMKNLAKYLILTIVLFSLFTVVNCKFDINGNTFISNVYAQTDENTNPSTSSQSDQGTSPATSPQSDQGTNNTTTAPPNPLSAKNLETVSKYASYVNAIFNPLINIISIQIGNLLSNDMILNGNMGTMMHNLWITSRNIVNVLFVFVLLFLAIKHIFGNDDDNTDLKKALPKFAIMLVAINFSWLAGTIVLDASNVITKVVFQIPVSSSAVSNNIKIDKCTNGQGTNTITGSCIPKKSYLDFSHTNKITNITDCDTAKINELNKKYSVNSDTGTGTTDAPTTTESSENEDSTKSKINGSTICWDTIDISKYNQNTASYFLSYSMAKVQNLSMIKYDKADNLSVGIMFSFILQIIYLISFLSLFLALIFRIAALWIFMAFLPFLVLLEYLIKDLNIPDFGISSHFSVQSFVKWAFAPVGVAAVWSIGFLMISAGQSIPKASTEFMNTEISTTIINIKSLFAGMDSLQSLIWFIMTAAIIWIGTFQVLGSLDFVGPTFNSIGNIGKNTLSAAGSVFKNLHILPSFTGGKSMSLDEMNPVTKLNNVARELMNPKDKFLSKTEESIRKASSRLNNMNNMSNKLDNLASIISPKDVKAHNITKPELISIFQKSGIKDSNNVAKAYIDRFYNIKKDNPKSQKNISEAKLTGDIKISDDRVTKDKIKVYLNEQRPGQDTDKIIDKIKTYKNSEPNLGLSKAINKAISEINNNDRNNSNTDNTDTRDSNTGDDTKDND